MGLRIASGPGDYGRGDKQQGGENERRRIKENCMTVIIAEFGSNPAYYNWNTAADCEYAARSGATHCKIQLFKADHFPAAEQESKRALEFPRQRAMEFSYNAARCGLVPWPGGFAPPGAANSKQ